MMFHRKCSRWLLPLALMPMISLAASEAMATTLAHLSVAEMSQVSPVIVRARCLSNSTRWDEGEIWTFSTFAVEEIWKGSVDAQITVRLLGGTSGNLTSTIAGVPRFRSGETVVLFLERTSHGDLSIVSWQQGTFRVHRDIRSARENVTQDTASFATFDSRTRTFEAVGIHDLAVDDLRQQVRAAISTAPARRQP